MSEPPPPSTSGRTRSARLGHRRLLRVGGLAVALAVAGLAVVVWLLTRSHEPAGAEATPAPSPSPTPLASLDLSDLPIARGPFCDVLDEDDVEDALGSPVVATRHYGTGERVTLTAGVRDLSHEYDCTFLGDHRARARAWVFAEPVSRPVAATIVRDVRTGKGCRTVPSAPTFGTPSVSTRCRTTSPRALTVTLRGLFSDAWLSCQLTEPDPGSEGAAGTGTVRRAEQWCVRVATTLGARP